MIDAAAADPVPGGVDVSRSTRTMAVLTAVSRATGFVRIAVVTNVLGATYLANTYQTSNTIPNILFELFAAGALQAVLIPAMVDLIDRGEDHETRHVVGAVLGLTSATLAGVTVIGIGLAPTLMRVMVSDVADAAVRAEQIRLGTFFLWFFLPQVVLYGANAVATAVLNATGSFGVPVFAPTINNVVVIGVYIGFAAMRRGRPPTLDLATSEKVLLAGGTTIAVVLFCALPIAVANRRVPLRPNLDVRHPRIRRLARDGGWAVAYLALTQALLVVMLQITNRREGAVAIYTLAWVVFLLPHSLLSVPVLTTRFPVMARNAGSGDWNGYGGSFGLGVRSISFVALPSSAILAATALPISRLLVHGETARRVPEIGAAIRGFAPGLLGLGLFLFATRACYAFGDTRSPTWVNLVVTAVGALIMLVAAGQVAPRLLVASVGAVYAATQTVAGALLVLRVHRRLSASEATWAPFLAAGARNLVAAAVAGGVAWWASAQLAADASTIELVAVLLGAGVAALTAYLFVQWALGGPGVLRALTTFGAATRTGDAVSP